VFVWPGQPDAVNRFNPVAALLAVLDERFVIQIEFPFQTKPEIIQKTCRAIWCIMWRKSFDLLTLLRPLQLRMILNCVLILSLFDSRCILIQKIR
jgi:hypothetical protein